MHMLPLFVALAFVCVVFAIPTKHVERSLSNAGAYVVTLKYGTDKTRHLQNLDSHSVFDDVSFVRYPWTNGPHHFYSAQLSKKSLGDLLAHPDVESIKEDGIAYPQIVVQTDSPWGIARLTQTAKFANRDDKSLKFSYIFDPQAGKGVDIYILDTGVFINHSDFGGRARWGATFGGYEDSDNNGHGSHVAGIAAGFQFGVAKCANIVAVKVLSDAGPGNVSDIVNGLLWVRDEYSVSRRPSIVVLSLATQGHDALDAAINMIIDAGIHVVVAAGNNGEDASQISPARVPSAITVAASNISDGAAPFSNYGSAVDLYAPGVNVMSVWINSTTATEVLSGTSMSAPHVAGIAAFLISREGNVTPVDMSLKLKSWALKNAVSGVPDSTPNLLASNDPTQMISCPSSLHLN